MPGSSTGATGQAGGADSDALVRLAASMEFFQGAALLHDDVMDRSDTRRGMPSAHRAVAALHAERGWDGDGDRFGEGAAILAGDLCLTWCDELYATCGLPAEELARGRHLFDAMRTQLMGEQFLDLLESVRGWDGLDLDERIASARQVIRFKSAKYTIEHPLRIGALVGGASDDDLEPLSDYGLALGEAFRCVTTCSVSSATPRRPASPRATTCARASGRCSSPSRSKPPRPRTVPSSTPCWAVTTSTTPACRRFAGCSCRPVRWRGSRTIATLADDARKAVGRAREGGRLDASALEVLEALVEVSTAQRLTVEFTDPGDGRPPPRGRRPVTRGELLGASTDLRLVPCPQRVDRCTLDGQCRVGREHPLDDLVVIHAAVREHGEGSPGARVSARSPRRTSPAPR